MSGKKNNKRKGEEGASSSPSDSSPPPPSSLQPSSPLPPTSANRPTRVSAAVGTAKRIAGGSSQRHRPIFHINNEGENPSSSSEPVDSMEIDGDDDNTADRESSSNPTNAQLLNHINNLSNTVGNMMGMIMEQKREASSSSSPSSSSSSSSPSPLPGKYTPSTAYNPINNVNATSSPVTTATGGTVNITMPPCPSSLSAFSAHCVNHLANNSTLSDIASRMAASTKQRADAAFPLFIPLAYFSPTKTTPIVGSGHTFNASHTARAEEVNSLFAGLFSHDNQELAEEKERKANAAVPRFTSFEEVITAFSAGLMPIVCKGNLDRFVDYTTLLTTIIAEHAKGQRHWPVYHRYIEVLRKRALLYGSPNDDPDVISKRKTHRLTTITPFDTVSPLDRDLLQECVELWTTSSRLFCDDFVDLATLQALYGAQTVVERSASLRHAPPPYQSSSQPNSVHSGTTAYPSHQGGYGDQSYQSLGVNVASPLPSTSQYQSSSSSPRPHNGRDKTPGKLIPGLTKEIIARIKALRPPNNACFAHIIEKCDSPCRAGRPHLSWEKVQHLLGEQK